MITKKQLNRVVKNNSKYENPEHTPYYERVSFEPRDYGFESLELAHQGLYSSVLCESNYDYIKTTFEYHNQVYFCPIGMVWYNPQCQDRELRDVISALESYAVLDDSGYYERIYELCLEAVSDELKGIYADNSANGDIDFEAFAKNVIHAYGEPEIEETHNATYVLSDRQWYKCLDGDLTKCIVRES